MRGEGSPVVSRLSRAAFTLAIGLSLLLGACDKFSGGPEPVRAWIAISMGEDPVARTGPVEIESGTEFTLHAVLEAGEGDRRVFYTEAKELVVAGEPIAAESLRVWDGAERASLLWFSVEGSAPAVMAEEGSEVEPFSFRENFRANWPRNWSIPGTVQPLRETAMVISPEKRPAFGTMRYYVRIELFSGESDITPKHRFASVSAETLTETASDFPTVTLYEPGSLRVPSAVFGTTQFEGPPEVIGERDLVSWVDQGLGFSRTAVLKQALSATGREWESLEWVEIDLAEGADSGSFERGALLRTGDRLVYLYRDLGTPGIDYDDLCLDFEDSARILSLADVFAGSGLVELATL